jgi:hypothetical protein
MSLLNAVEQAEKAIEKAKKLTTKDRKKLPKSAYCGPNKSFPVPDCQHVSTAKAFLNRSKFSKSTKQKIAACINKKAKALKCSGDKKAKAYTQYTYAKLTIDEQFLYDSDIFASTKKLVDESLIMPENI